MIEKHDECVSTPCPLLHYLAFSLMHMVLPSAQITDKMKASLSTTLQLSAYPDSYPLYMLHFYPFSLKLLALLTQSQREEH